MNDDRDDNDEPAGGSDGAAPRVRFSGIVESDARATAAQNGAGGLFAMDHDDRRWNAMSRQVWQAARLVAILVFFCFVVGLPLGNWIAHRQIYGSAEGWNVFAAYDPSTLIFAFIVPLVLLLLGYMLSRMATMMNAAESIAAAAQQFISPDVSAAKNADSVGEIVRGHMAALNENLDGALSRLASVESMIRDHVAAIELAGEAIELKATGAVARVADERSRLMELTESLNAHADSFAAAIAERAKASIQALESADTLSSNLEQDFDERLTRLEDAAARAFSSFESLREALGDTGENIVASTEAIDAAAQETLRATERANAASDAAAESAARNAANVSASANRASQAAKEAAMRAIETAREEAENIAQSALDAASEESGKVQEATRKALSDMSSATKEALEAARAEAEKATQAAKDVSDAARQTGDAAKVASRNVSAASERARKSSEEALQYSETAAGRIEERNKALAEARAELEKENARLEILIEEQRKRADRLAEAIASQTERLSRLAEAQLREQEASARLAEAQNEMQARAAKEAEDAEKAAKEEAPRKPQAEESAAREKAEKDQAAKEKAAREEKQIAREKPPKEEDVELELAPEDRKPPPADRGAARLDEIARDIAGRRPQKERPQKERWRKEPPIEGGAAKPDPERRTKGDVSWREILDAAEDAEPLDLGAVAKKTSTEARDEAADAIRIISRLQDFTYELETRLYGDPPPALQERFDRGDRNVFANRLLRLNEADVKRRIRSESARDREFEQGVHHFLQGFERLLEDATTSETADEELEEYLGSPLGRVYLLIGATVGYFA